MHNRYSFTARTFEGKKESGYIVGDNEKSVVTELRRKGLFVLDIRDVSKTKRTGFLTSLPFYKNVHRLSTKDSMILSRQLGAMLCAGLPLIEAMDVLKTQSFGQKLAVVIANVSDRIQTGVTLHESFDQEGHVFPNLMIDMLRVGEESGNLDEVLSRLGNYYEKELYVKEQLKNAMVYPLLVLLASIAALYILLIMVLPEFAQVFVSSGVDMPMSTQFMLTGASYFREHLLMVIFAAMGLLFGGSFILSSSIGDKLLNQLKGKLPFIGDIYQKVVVSRFSRSFSTLLRSGMTMSEAILLLQQTDSNKALYLETTRLIKSIEQGHGMTSIYHQEGFFPPFAKKMILVGEESGQLPEMLDQVADFYEEEVGHAIKRLSSIAEPVMIVLMMLLVGFIVLSVVLPMVEMWTLY